MLIPVSRPFVGDEECEAVSRVIRTFWLSTGSEVSAFEKELSSRFGSRVVAVSSGSMGLELALAAQGIRREDEVIVPAITFVATSNVVFHLGAKPVFADIDPLTGLLDFDDVQKKITSKTRAIMPVDLYGQRVDLKPYVDLKAERGNITIVEDAAQAFGTPGVGGVEGVVSVFSFHATKNVTMGEGGAVVTTDANIGHRIRILSQQGVTADAFSRYHGAKGYDVVEVGYKGNLADLMAAIGRVQLRKEDGMRRRRQEICKLYRSKLPLRTIDWSFPTNYHLYPAFVEDRASFRDSLLRLNIGTGIHFECVPSLTAYRRLGYKASDTPAAAQFGVEEVTLPTYAGLTDADTQSVVQAVLQVLPRANA